MNPATTPVAPEDRRLDPSIARARPRPGPRRARRRRELRRRGAAWLPWLLAVLLAGATPAAARSIGATRCDGVIGGTSPGRGPIGSAVGCGVGDGGAMRSPSRLHFDGAPLPRAAVPPRPDFLVVLADDLNERLFAVLDRMGAIADRGMRFRATAPSPLCGPARASLLTGLHNHNHGIVTNGAQNPLIWGERHAGRALPNWLKAEGYRTVLAGKLLNGCTSCLFGGWDVVIRQEREKRTRRRWYWVDEMASRIAAEIRVAAREQPMLILFAPPSPHAPFVPRPRYAGTLAGSPEIRASVLDVPSFNEVDVSDKRHPRIVASPLLSDERIERIVATRERRAEMMLSVTDALEDILDALKRAGRLESTYVIFLSDNGYLEGEHRRSSGKSLPYEEAVTVPMFVLGPDVPRGTSDALVYNHDVTATIADLAGATTPPLDGRSLAPLWRGETTAWRERVLLEHYDRRRGRVFSGVRERDRKAVSFRDGTGETYDLASDPYEIESVDETSGFRAASADVLHRLLSCRGDECWAAETEILDDARRDRSAVPSSAP